MDSYRAGFCILGTLFSNAPALLKIEIAKSMGQGDSLVQRVAKIWRMHKKQEGDFRAVMRIEISPELRRLCACGHMSSVLFLKEICSLYENVKNCLEDGDLNSIVMTRQGLVGSQGLRNVLQQLFYSQQDLLNAYNELIEEDVLGGDALLFCQDHFAQLLRLHMALKKEVRSFELGTKHAYLVVA